VGPEGVLCRVVVATHQASKKKSRVGITRAGIVYELFFTNLPQLAFTASDVVELYLHRGAFEPQRITMKTTSRTLTGGAAIRPGDRNAGRWCPNGYGISGSNWAINWSRRLCASPSLLLLFH
jgi:hypothetical protein